MEKLQNEFAEDMILAQILPNSHLDMKTTCHNAIIKNMDKQVIAFHMYIMQVSTY